MNDLDLNKKLINLMESAMVEEAKSDMPDFPDIDGDGNKKETMKKAAKDKKKVSEAEEKDEKMPSKAEVMKCCKDGMSASEICKKYPDCDQDKLKELCKDCKDDMKEKTDESVNILSGSLREKLTAVMETSTDVTEESVSEEDLDEDVESESVSEQEEVTEEESLDEMAELLKMAGLGENTASCSSMPRRSMPTTGSEQGNGYEGNFVGEEEEHEADDHDAHMDDEAEEAGEEATHQIELDRDEHEAMKSLLKKLLDS